MLNQKPNQEKGNLAQAVDAESRNERWWLVALLLPLLLAGCGGQTTQPPEEFKHFKAIAVIYGKYQGRNGGKKPQNLDEFKAFVEKGQADLLSRFGVKNAAELLVSPRDGEPLVFDFSSPANPSIDPIIAYEQTGVSGYRVVVSALGSVNVLDKEQFNLRVK